MQDTVCTKQFQKLFCSLKHLSQWHKLPCFSGSILLAFRDVNNVVIWVYVVGSNVHIPSEVIVLNCVVLPYKELNASTKNRIILWFAEQTVWCCLIRSSTAAPKTDHTQIGWTDLVMLPYKELYSSSKTGSYSDWLNIHN